jgi:GTPase
MVDTLNNTITKQYILIDSAGIRKQGQREYGAESTAVYHTIEATWESDVICLVVDGSEPVSHQDQVIAGIAKESRKGIIIIANKADLVDKEGQKNFERSFYKKFAFLKIYKFIWVSAVEHTGLNEIWNSIDNILIDKEKEIDPQEVRKLFNYLIKHKQPTKLRTERKAVMYDLLYISNNPHTFELLVKNRKTITKNYMTFLENVIRRQFGLESSGAKIKITEVDRKNIMN